MTYGAPYERDIGMVFQNYALFPHMTVGENIAFPLKMRKVDARRRASKRAAEALELVRLPHVAQRFPRELSGGQQQRIALARCLVYQPVDRADGRAARRARQEAARPDAARDQAHPPRARHDDRLRHARPGRGDDDVRPHLPDERRDDRAARHAAELYFRPRTLFVADFLGESNLLEGTVERVDGAGADVALAQGRRPRAARRRTASWRPAARCG